MAGAKPMISPNKPIARPRFSAGNILSSTTIVSGIMMPAAAAWTILPARRSVNTGDTAEISVPTVNSVIAKIYNLRVVNLLIRNAVTGIMMPFTRKNPVVSHWAVLNGMSRSAIIEGTAVTSSVWFNIVMKAPMIRLATTKFLSLKNFDCLVFILTLLS